MTDSSHTTSNQVPRPEVGVVIFAGDAQPSPEELQVERVDRKLVIDELWKLKKVRDNLLQQIARSESAGRRSSAHHLKLMGVVAHIEVRQATLGERLMCAEYPIVLRLSHRQRMDLCDLWDKLERLAEINGTTPVEEWKKVEAKKPMFPDHE
jgi:hypothetical protein